MNRRNYLTTLGAMTLLAMSQLSAQTTTVVNDTFSSGTAADNGWYKFASNAGTSLTVSDGNLTYAIGETRPGAVKSFSPVTLANAGDYITLDLTLSSYSFGGTANTTLQSFIVSLGNHQGSPVTADAANQPLTGANDFIRFSFRANPATPTSFDTFRHYRDMLSPVNDSGSGGNYSLGSTPIVPSTGTNATVSLTITRLANGDLTISGSALGQALTPRTYATTAGDADTVFVPELYTFNMLGLGLNSQLTGDTFSVDSLTVTTNVQVADPSVPVVNINVSGGNLEILCSSESGFDYILQTSPTMATGTWANVETKTGTGSSLTYTVPQPASDTKAFYRVFVQ